MAEEPGRLEGSERYSNPFDAKTSDRIPFPSFEAALANSQSTGETEHQGTESALDWSIDTLAELKPVAFSPQPEQKDGANLSETPRRTSGFFEDEKQYEALRTPLLARVTRDTNRNRTPLTSSSPMELHRRCRDTIARCEAALRERQRKMDKLQAVLPPPTPKSPHQRLIHQRASPPSRSTPPRPVKRNKLSSAATPHSEWMSPRMRPPKWSASPIAVVGKRPLCATPATLHFDTMTPSPLVNTPRSTTPKQSSKLRLSFGLSPITFPSPEQTQEEEKEEEKSEEKRHAPSNEDTLPLSSSEESAASEFEKENEDQQAQIERQHKDPSSSHGTSTSAMRTPAVKKSARSSIPRRRQQAFMEAMEAEARSSDNRSPQVTKPSTLSRYQEAKRLGVTDRQAQWQYVQSLRRREQKQKQKR